MSREITVMTHDELEALIRKIVRQEIGRESNTADIEPSEGIGEE